MDVQSSLLRIHYRCENSAKNTSERSVFLLIVPGGKMKENSFSRKEAKMQTGIKNKRFFSRQPLSVFSKIAVATFFGMTIICGIMSFFSSLEQVTVVGSM